MENCLFYLVRYVPNLVAGEFVNIDLYHFRVLN